MKTIELTYDQIDAIVVGELKEAYRLLVADDYDEGGCLMEKDWGLIHAIEQILAFSLPAKEYFEWKESVTI